MIIKQKPLDESKYLKVDAQKNKELQKKGFIPMYAYDGFYYYLKQNGVV